MVHFSLNIKVCCLYVIWEKEDKIWPKIFCIPKNMHSRTPMLVLYHLRTLLNDICKCVSSSNERPRLVV